MVHALLEMLLELFDVMNIFPPTCVYCYAVAKVLLVNHRFINSKESVASCNKSAHRYGLHFKYELF